MTASGSTRKTYRYVSWTISNSALNFYSGFSSTNDQDLRPNPEEVSQWAIYLAPIIIHEPILLHIFKHSDFGLVDSENNLTTPAVADPPIWGKSHVEFLYIAQVTHRLNLM